MARAFLQELRRRNVFRIGTAYVVTAWLVIQVVETILPAFGFGDEAMRNLVAVLAIGLVPTVILAWAFELTPEGLKREKYFDGSRPIAPRTARRLDRMIMVMLALALVYFAFDKFVLDPARHEELVEDTSMQTRVDVLQESYGDKSIAVLPFVNLSPDPGQEYFSDGIAEELLNLLAQIPELRVISRSSAFRFKGREIDIPSVAEQLRVTKVLEGSVRKAGNQVRISTQLIEARSDTTVWSDTYDLELTTQDIFGAQTQIAEQIARALNAVLLKDARERIHRVPTHSLEAYEAYLMGRHLMTSRRHADLERAAGYFAQAVERDPEFALGWVGLADAKLLRVNYGAGPAEAILGAAESALSQALSLDNQLGPAFTSLGLSKSLGGDSVAAEGAYARAIELDPSYATSYHWYADLLINSFGEAAKAIPLLEKARTLDPLSPIISVTLGEALAWTGDLPAAILHYRKALDVEPDLPAAYFLLGQIYIALGDDASAEDWIDRGADRIGDEPGVLQAKALLHLYRKEPGKALEVVRQLLTVAPRDNLALYTLVSIGHFEEAVEQVASDFPELSCASRPAISRSNVFQAMNLSLALQETGHRECANQLLAGVLDFMRRMPRQGHRSLGFLDCEVYARQGETERALTALEQGIEAGVRVSWWSQVERSPHTVALRESPRFDALRTAIRAEMAAQLALVRQMRAAGALPPLPD